MNIKLSLLKRLLRNTRHFHSSRIKQSYEGPEKTTVDIINNTMNQKGPLFVNKCLPIGFILSDSTLVVGPIAMFPQAIFSWNVGSAKDINKATLSLFTIINPALDLLILGLETNYKYQDQLKIKRLLSEFNLKAEILPVHQACGVYNFLINEGRYVAAGLIPPLPEETPEIKKINEFKGKKQIHSK